MTVIDEIYAALFASDQADFPEIKKYVLWLAVRRRIHNRFFLRAHWAKPSKRYHWVT